MKFVHSRTAYLFHGPANRGNRTLPEALLPGKLVS